MCVDICRVCHCQYDDLENHIHDLDPKPHQLWSVNEYDRIVESFEDELEDATSEIDSDTENPELEGDEAESAVLDDSFDSEVDLTESSEFDQEPPVDKRGIKSSCPLNVLESFHSVWGFVPDVMHDLMEGVIPLDLLAIIRILSRQGWFTIVQYNAALANLGYPAYEGGDKPCPVPDKSNVKKLKGKAVSNWVHLRNWPLIVKHFVKDYDDPVLNLGLKLHDLVERLCAQEFISYEISILDDKIVDYLELRKLVRQNFPNIMPNPKPKHHYLRKETFHSGQIV